MVLCVVLIKENQVFNCCLLNITLHNLGRRFNQEWIFRSLDYTLSSSKSYAVLGPNGSGKSTLLKVLTGQLSPSEGKIVFEDATSGQIHVDDVYQYLTIAAPYVELIEEFTLNELLDFHFKFKSFLPGHDKASVLSYLAMDSSANKVIKYFSSGMKQRVKLALACFSDSRILLLDEPTSNLDVEGERWYLELLARTVSPGRLIIIGSNQEKEYAFCTDHIHILDYKHQSAPSS